MNFLFNRIKQSYYINICYLDCKIYCLICFDKNTKHRRAFSFRDMHKAFNVKIRVTCIISVNKMRCDKWFSLLLPFHLDSTNSYLTISIQIEEKSFIYFGFDSKVWCLDICEQYIPLRVSRDIKSYQCDIKRFDWLYRRVSLKIW